MQPLLPSKPLDTSVTFTLGSRQCACNAAINPDAVGYLITLKDGTAVAGTRLAETDTELQIAQPGGAVAKLAKADITKTEPMATSLMPAGLDKTLTKEELRDLMTFLLTEAPSK